MIKPFSNNPLYYLPFIYSIYNSYENDRRSRDESEVFLHNIVTGCFIIRILKAIIIFFLSHVSCHGRITSVHKPLKEQVISMFV